MRPPRRTCNLADRGITPLLRCTDRAEFESLRIGSMSAHPNIGLIRTFSVQACSASFAVK